MPLPFAIPLIPVMKIVAIGSIKTILLFVGALVVPQFTLRVMIKGAAGILIPVARWLDDRDKRDGAERIPLDTVRLEVDKMLAVEYSRDEAREILMGLVKKTIKSMGEAVVGLPAATARLFKKMFSGISNQPK